MKFLVGHFILITVINQQTLRLLLSKKKTDAKASITYADLRNYIEVELVDLAGN
jgi:hypothetical protein